MDEIFGLSRNFLRNKNRGYKRSILHDYLFKNKLSILLGARGIGKTTLIIQHILSEYDLMTRKALYFPTDHFALGNRSLYEIAELFCNNGGELLCLDEIHKYKDWAKELKSIADTFPSLKVIASGSSILEITKGSHDLSRRAVVQRIYGLSFREYIELNYGNSFRKIDLDVLLKGHELIANDIVSKLGSLKVLAIFKDYLRRGYYPYSVEFNENDDGFYTTLEQSIHTTIESDLIAVYPQLNGSSIKKIKMLLSIIAQLVPFKPDLKSLKTSLDIGDERTLKTYLHYLQEGNILQLIMRDKAGLNVLDKPEKIYLNDTNQMFALRGLNCNIGTIRETFFASTLSVCKGITYSDIGDFKVDDYVFEVGGNGKSFNQIKNIEKSFLVVDEKEIGFGNKIPLWLFGFLY